MVRPLDLSALEPFIVLRSASYVGWIASRLDEEGAMARNARSIGMTRRLARSYLSESGVSA